MDRLIDALRALASVIAGFWARGLVDDARAAQLSAEAYRAVADAGRDTHDDRLRRLESKGRLRRVPADKRK